MVAAMYTPDYSEQAARLKASCERFELRYVLHEVPEVHKSISAVNGTEDLSFTKANYVQCLLDRYALPILYLDADCVIRSRPSLIDKLVDQATDFAIFNWAAEPDNEAFLPIDVRFKGKIVRGRYYAFSHRADCYAPDQLICSGLVQLYANTAVARQWLRLWHDTIRRFPGAADDGCLSYAFNNRDERWALLKHSWLPKAYARYAWWIDVEPVIDHPDTPNLEYRFAPIAETAEGKFFFPERGEITPARFPERCIIDVQDKMLYEVVGSKMVPLAQLDCRFWVDPQVAAALTMDLELP